MLCSVKLNPCLFTATITAISLLWLWFCFKILCGSFIKPVFNTFQTRDDVVVRWSESSQVAEEEWPTVSWRPRGGARRMPAPLVIGKPKTEIDGDKWADLMKQVEICRMGAGQRRFYVTLPHRYVLSADTSSNKQYWSVAVSSLAEIAAIHAYIWGVVLRVGFVL